jgi:hypothetical protein
MYTYTIIFKGPHGLPACQELGQAVSKEHAKRIFLEKNGEYEIISVYENAEILEHEQSLIEGMIGVSEVSMMGASLVLRIMDALLKANPVLYPGYELIERTLDQVADEVESFKDEAVYQDELEFEQCAVY